MKIFVILACSLASFWYRFDTFW